jgi:VIT1/CCC1 family predicted Fe2+/Mn2+ transporter
MSDSTSRSSWKKRLLLLSVGLLAFVLLFVVTIRITVREMFDGIASSRASGLSSVEWDSRSMWSSTAFAPMLQKGSVEESWIARTADLRSRSSSYEHSVATLHQIVATHHGYFEDLRTESRSGFGRALAAALAVPSDDFDSTLTELQRLGRVESISQAGEDSAVKIATATRRLSAAQTNLSRLQKLQRERKGELRDAVALEKDIAQASESVAEAERQRDSLQSTVSLSHIRFTLLEDYRAPFRISLADSFLQIRNALADGIGAIFSTLSVFLSTLLAYGLPLLFWLTLFFFPSRIIWRRFHRTPASPATA